MTSLRPRTLLVVAFLTLGVASRAPAEGTQSFSSYESVNFLPTESRGKDGNLTPSDPVGGGRYRENLGDCRISPLYFRLKSLLDKKEKDSLYNMKALDLLSFLPDRTVAGKLWEKVKGTKGQEKQIIEAIYQQLKDKKTIYPAYKLAGDKQSAVFDWVRYTQVGIKIPFPAEQEEDVRKVLIERAQAELDRIEPILRRQHEAFSTESGRSDAMRMAGRYTDLMRASKLPYQLPEGVKLPKDFDANAMYKNYLQFMPRPKVEKMPDSYPKSYGGPGAVRVDFDGYGMLLNPSYNPIGCYAQALYWKTHSREIGKKLSEKDETTLFTPPMNEKELAAQYELMQRLNQADWDWRKMMADIERNTPQLRAWHPRPGEENDSHDYSDLWRPFQSNSFASGLRGRYERESEAQMERMRQEMELEAGD